MQFRVFGLAAAAALAGGASPAAAQQFSDSYQFLEAVRDANGAKVNEYLSDQTNTIVNTRDRNTGEGALHIVANRRDATYLRFLLQQRGINANLQDRSGATPILVATTRNWDEGVNILIRYRANVNTPNSRGETPLIIAVQMHNSDIVRALLAAGADADRSDNVAGLSARDYAKRETRYPQIAKMLADAPKAGAKPAAAGPKVN